MLRLTPTRQIGRASVVTGALSATELVSWGVLYYGFAVFLTPMREEFGAGTGQLTGAFSAGVLMSAVAGVAVGRHLDRGGARGLMTAGSVAGVVLVLAWSQVQSVAMLYVVWIGLGVVMAAVLYEPAFTVLAKHHPDPASRRRAMTVLTLVGALASFIFLPLSQLLVEALGWRDALVVLAVVLAVVTVPLHALALREPDAQVRAATAVGAPAARALRSRGFWLLSAAFVLATVAAMAMMIHAIPYLTGRGMSPAWAAGALGLVGISQIPGRLVFAPLARRLSPARSSVAVFLLIAAGVALVVSAPVGWMTVGGLVVLGVGNGMATLARATAMADLYGTGAYGTIAGVAAAATTTARAAAPVVAAVFAAAFGYVALLWVLVGLAVLAALLAHCAEVTARPAERTAVPATATMGPR